MFKPFSRSPKPQEWNLDGINAPWGDRESIYEYLKAHLDAHVSSFPSEELVLPDEAEVKRGKGLPFASGALDGIMTHHSIPNCDKKEPPQVYALMKKVIERPDQEHVDDFYQALKDCSAVGLAGPLLRLVIDHRELHPDKLFTLAYWLATGAADREPVKIGTALMGLLVGENDENVLTTLAGHDEFTMNATMAIINKNEDYEELVWAIAKRVHGWGRIHAVEAMPKIENPDFKAWLLREGFRNSIMTEYLVQACVAGGDLNTALKADRIDDELMLGASELLYSMMNYEGGPGVGIEEYLGAAEDLGNYVRHLQDRTVGLFPFLLLKKFERFLADDQANWEERKVGGWDADNRQAVLDAVVRVVGGDQWAAIVQAGLESDDQFEFETALQAAQYVGIDPWDELYRRSGVGQQYWYQLTRTSDAERIRRVVDLAERTIPLAEIATGPDTELGFGPEYQHHNNLDCILQRLGGHPELGWTLIETGMRSPLVRNRYKSVKALAGWPRDQWPQGAQEHVERCSEAEPDGKLRARFQELLDGTV